MSKRVQGQAPSYLGVDRPGDKPSGACASFMNRQGNQQNQHAAPISGRAINRVRARRITNPIKTYLSAAVVLSVLASYNAAVRNNIARA